VALAAVSRRPDVQNIAAPYPAADLLIFGYVRVSTCAKNGAAAPAS